MVLVLMEGQLQGMCFHLFFVYRDMDMTEDHAAIVLYDFIFLWIFQ
jgi:hypothetical protein